MKERIEGGARGGGYQKKAVTEIHGEKSIADILGVV